jgi:hypothetical protein
VFENEASLLRKRAVEVHLRVERKSNGDAFVFVFIIYNNLFSHKSHPVLPQLERIRH